MLILILDLMNILLLLRVALGSMELSRGPMQVRWFCTAESLVMAYFSSARVRHERENTY
jgi:hypothetical protein